MQNIEVTPIKRRSWKAKTTDSISSRFLLFSYCEEIFQGLELWNKESYEKKTILVGVVFKKIRGNKKNGGTKKAWRIEWKKKISSG